MLNTNRASATGCRVQRARRWLSLLAWPGYADPDLVAMTQQQVMPLSLGDIPNVSRQLPSDAQGAPILLARADAAMYRAKLNRRKGTF